LLFVGTLEPRKNVANLIEAYGRLEDGLRDKHPLVIVGKKGWFYGEIFRKVRELSLEERVRFLGYLPEEELPAIYNGAGVFLYPSWYEGFGLPVLEAMACGVPVITSDTSSLPEVAGEETILVKPGDVEELKNGIELILTDREKARRVREKGIKRAGEFTWRQTAELTLETMEKVGEEAKS